MFRGKSSILGFSYMHYIKITTNLFSSNIFFMYGLGYFKKNIFDEIDNKVTIKWFQNIKLKENNYNVIVFIIKVFLN